MFGYLIKPLKNQREMVTIFFFCESINGFGWPFNQWLVEQRKSEFAENMEHVMVHPSVRLSERSKFHSERSTHAHSAEKQLSDVML